MTGFGSENWTAGRRGRKSYAEDAKAIPKDNPIDLFKVNIVNVVVIWSYIAIELVVFIVLEICNLSLQFRAFITYQKLPSVFFRYSFASSAKLLRPLRPAARY